MIKIGHMNIRGIKSKMMDIKTMLDDSKMDVIVFTETKLEKKEKREFEGYKCLNLNRKTPAGGVCFLIKNDLKATVIKENKECETLWVEITGKVENLIIGGTYSPCEYATNKQTIKEFVDKLDRDLQEMTLTGKPVMVVGDLNAHIGNDDEGIPGNNNKIGPNGKEYREFIRRNELVLVNSTQKCVGKWTRIQGEKKSILDLTIANQKAYDCILNMVIDENMTYSMESKVNIVDHRMTVLHYKLNPKKEAAKYKTVRVVKPNWEKYKERLRTGINALKNNEEKLTYDQIESIINSAGMKVIEKRKIKIKKQVPMIGYNKEIKQAISERRQAMSRWKREKEDTEKELLKEKYLQLKIKAQKLIQENQAKAIKSIINDNFQENPNFWKLMKKLTRKQSVDEGIGNEEGKIVREVKEILQVKRNYFEKLYSKVKVSIDENATEEEVKRDIIRMMQTTATDIADEGKRKEHEKLNALFSQKEVEDSIRFSKNSKAPGSDNVINEMLKEGIEYIAPILTLIFNEMLEKDKPIPETWRLGDIISIFKGKGEKLDMKNQRGLSMTSSVLKCLEKIVANRISPLIKRYTTDLQGGGKQNESTVEYLFMLQTAIDKNKKRGKDTKLIITDVSKAFDQAWRTGVFGNLTNRNIKGRMLRLIWEINNDLKARIKFDEEQYSQTFEVEDSIRQGSGLSAILYAQHAAKIIEDLEEIDIGIKIGGKTFPAIG